MADKFVPSAKVVDGILVLSLPDAVSPVVWRMELGDARTSALEIRDREDGSCVLTVKTPRQDAWDVAAYATKDKALAALRCVSLAMEKAGGQLRFFHGIPRTPEKAEGGAVPLLPVVSPHPAYGAEGHHTKFWRLLALGVVVLAFALFFVKRPMGPQMEGGGIFPSAPSSDSAAIGKPISADDFLEGR